jgi:hypothetical protein
MTYNVNAPRGLQRVYNVFGAANTPDSTYPIASGYATAIFKGDPVTLLADGTIGIGVAGSAIIGVFQGVKYTNTAGIPVNSPNWIASTATLGSVTAQALVTDDPMAVFTIQETNAAGAAGTPLALADVNLNANFLVGSGIAALGLSTTSLNNASEATTATLNLKILGLDNYPNNAVGSFANWFVRINNHITSGGTGTAGV